MLLNSDKNVVVSMTKVILKEKIGAVKTATNAQPIQATRSPSVTEASRTQ